MSYFDRALSKIEEGIQGLNVGIPIPFEKLSHHIPNIQKSTYYLVLASTKVGKTSLADDLFFYSSYDYYKKLKDTDTLGNFKLDIDYFSYEIDINSKIIKGISRRLWHEYGIVADSNIILSKGKNHCSQELYDLIKGFRIYFNELEEICTIHEMPDNATGIHKHLMKKAENFGTIEKININQDPQGTPIMRFNKYIPNYPNLYRLAFVDHIKLIKSEREFTDKQNIDKLSEFMVLHRNNFGLTPIIIQQLNSEVDNDDRHKSNRLTPTIRDIGDSKYTARDASVIIALFNPSSYKLEKFRGYNIAKLGDTFRNLEILVNREGEPNINLGLNFIGPCGTFRELPKPEEMSDGIYEAASNLTNGKSTYIKENGIWIKNPVLEQ